MTLEEDIKKILEEQEAITDIAKKEEVILSKILALVFKVAEFNPDGTISNATDMNEILNAINKIFEDNSIKSETLKVLKDYDKIKAAQLEYFKEVSDVDPDKLKDIVENSDADIDNTLGVADRFGNGNPKEFTEGSLLQQTASSSQTKAAVGAFLTKAVLAELTKDEIEEKLTKEVTGSLAQELNTVVLSKTRRTLKEIGEEVGLNKYWIYNGTTRDESRKFCEGGTDAYGSWHPKKGEVFHIDEIKTWYTLQWEGKPRTGYDPFTSAPNMGPGGHRCVDVLSPVSVTIAYSMRPELEDYDKDPSAFVIISGRIAA